jgi:hypothetical protein
VDWYCYNFQSLRTTVTIHLFLILPLQFFVSLKYVMVYAWEGLRQLGRVHGVIVFSYGQNCPSTFLSVTDMWTPLFISFPIFSTTACAAVGPALLPLPRACTTGGRHSPHARASRCSSSARRKRALPLAACRAPTCVSPLDTMASTSASRITSSGDDRTYLPVSSSIFVSSSAGTGVGEWRSQI